VTDDLHHRDPEVVFARAVHAHHDGARGLHDNHEKAQEFFQSSMVSALLQGIYDGEMTFGELAKHGDFGLGTFDALDGEMVLIDGRFHQLKSDGRAYDVPPDWTTPFASVMFFEAEMERGLSGPMTRADVESLLAVLAPKKNGFYAIRLDGLYSWMKVRSVPRQSKPYPPLVEVVKHQPVFEFENVRGSLIGFRLPDYTVGINVPGYHLHFIDDARTCGGHMTEFTLADGRLQLDHTINLHLEIPEANRDFDAAELASGNVGGEIKTAES
jgi:acetolactate decarboxylase